LSTHRTGGGPSTLKLVVAFAAVYIVWGSTYLAIKFVVTPDPAVPGSVGLPPFIMAGARFVLAGAILYAWARYKGAVRAKRFHWGNAGMIGTLLLCGGNGGVVWAEKSVPSGLTALIVATVSLWIVLVDWLRPRGVQPTMKVVLGVFLGLAGVAILVGPSQFAGAQRVDPIGAGVLVFAAFSWAVGSVLSKHVKLPSSGLLTTGMEMLCGGVSLLVFGSLMGDWGKLQLSHVSIKSVISLGYLVVFGSLIGFTAYMWLLKHTEPARAATYAYVNPIVAVILGWLVANEPLSWRTAIAAAVIVTGVAFITRGARPTEAKGRDKPLGADEEVASIDAPLPHEAELATSRR
jgi:drug/metabolite transporter (DMT)-like permease